MLQAANQETRPRNYVTSITSSFPNNNLSPFYDPTGAKMKPLAKLTLQRQRLYTKNCSNNSDKTPNTATSKKTFFFIIISVN